MPKALTLRDIVHALTERTSSEGQRPVPRGLEVKVSSVVVDSRQAVEGSVFVALRGEQTDGHLHVQDAFDRGAICAIVQEVTECGSILDLCALDKDSSQVTGALYPLPGASSQGAAETTLEKVEGSYSLPVCIMVRNSLAALQQMAAWWRAQFVGRTGDPVRVIGITGSVGKTTTKEFVASVLAQRYRVLKSRGNYNNEVGLPLTLLQLNDSHERVVLEMGTYGPGEITLLAEIARPHIGIVTNVGPVHLERMGTIERIAEAKSELPQALPADGVAVLNADDKWVRSMAQKTRACVFFYGLGDTERPADSEYPLDLWADHVESRGLEGVRLQFHHISARGKTETIHAHIPLLGRHSVHTALRAAAVGVLEGLSWDEILNGLRTGEQLRLVVVPGVNGSTLLDDTYNSSPDSAIAALNLLDELNGRKVAVLGDMLELGVYETEGHRRVARRAMDVVSLLVTVGELGQQIGKEALDYGMSPERVLQVTDNEQAIAYLRGLVQEGDMVLIKGSRGMYMEQIVEALACPPGNGSAMDQDHGWPADELNRPRHAAGELRPTTSEGR